jgi:hypothetical protein
VRRQQKKKITKTPASVIQLIEDTAARVVFIIGTKIEKTVSLVLIFILIFATSYMSLKYFNFEQFDQLTQPDLSPGASVARGYVTANIFTSKDVNRHRRALNVAKQVTVKHFDRYVNI